MLYSILVIICITAIVALALLCVRCYRLGLRDGMQVATGKQPALQTLAGPTVRKDATRDAHLDAVLANLERYDGTDTGQQEVKP